MGLKRHKPTRKIILLSLLASLASVSSIPKAISEEVDVFCEQKMLSHLMVDIFLEKVDKGEVLILERKLSRSDLQPCKVAYIHDTSDNSFTIHLYFKLKTKILMPGSEDLYIDGITVITDENGSITRISTFEAFPFDMVDPE